MANRSVVPVFDSVASISIIWRIFWGMRVYCMNIARIALLFKSIGATLWTFSDNMLHY
jgi:hypothetical protein